MSTRHIKGTKMTQMDLLKGTNDEVQMQGVPEETTGGAVPTESNIEVGLHMQGVCSEKTSPGPLQQEGEAPDSIIHLQDRITNWADRVFPERTAEGALTKLVLEEIPELLHGGLDDPLEYADVLILVLDIAALRGIDAVAAAHEKMTINEARKWKKNLTTGMMSHIEESDND